MAAGRGIRRDRDGPVTERGIDWVSRRAFAALPGALWLCSLPGTPGYQAPDPATLTDRGLELAQSGQTATAADLWRQALKLAPEYFPALFNLGYMHFSAGQFETSRPLLERAATASPEDFNALYLLGVVNQKLGRVDDALQAWRRALGIRPDQFQLMQVMAVEYGKGRYHREAADLSLRALRLRPDVEDLYYMAIHACREAGDLGAGLEIASRASERYPLSARANFEYAWHLQKDGRFDEALPFLRKAIELDPEYEEPHFFYGDWLVKQARYEEALDPLRKAVALRTDYMPARIAMARALMGAKKWPEAVDTLLAAVRIEPRHPQPHLLLSQVYFRLRDRRKARAAKELSLRLRRENPAFLEAVQSRPFPE